MSVTWTISVGGRPYGPYTLEQMQGFQTEGRLAPHSLIARNGEEKFHHASEDADLVVFFSAVKSEPQAAAALSQSEPQPVATKFGRDVQAAGERSRYVIIADMKSGSISALDEEISNFGNTFRFAPQTWILSTEVSLSTLRSELIQKLGKLDTLMVVDTTHDKAAWFNFGPEADSRMRRLWQREAVPSRNPA